MSATSAIPVPYKTWNDPASILPLRRAEIIETEVEGEAILFDPRNNHTHRLNQTAFHVWRECDGRSSTLDIAQRQVAAYDVDLPTALDHVEQLVLLLTEAGLFTLSMNPRWCEIPISHPHSRDSHPAALASREGIPAGA